MERDPLLLEAAQQLAASVGLGFSGGQVFARYRLGDYYAVALQELSAVGATALLFALVVSKGEEEEPTLLLLLQENKFARFYSQGSHSLVAVQGGKRSDVGNSNDWVDSEAFVRNALGVARDRLAVSEEPVVFAPRKKKPRPPAIIVPEPLASEPPSAPPLPPARSFSPHSGFSTLHWVISGIGIAILVLKLLHTLSKASSLSPSQPPSYAVSPTSALGESEAAARPSSPIALDDTHVYWSRSTEGKVMRTPKGGGEAVLLYSAGGRDILGLALVGERLYVTVGASARGPSLGWVAQIPKTGGYPKVPVWIRAKMGPLVASGDRVFFLADRPLGGSTLLPGGYGNVFELERADKERLLQGPIVTSRTLAVDSTHVYWGDWTGKRMMSAALEGGSPTALSSEPVKPELLAVDSTSVYFTTPLESGVGIHQFSKSGGASSVVVVRSGVAIVDLVVDEEALFWVEEEGGLRSILRLEKGGRRTETVVSEVAKGVRLAVDATHIYWSTPEGFERVSRKAQVDAGKVREAGVTEGGKEGGAVAREAGRVVQDAGSCGGL